MSKARIPYFDFYPADFMHGIRGLTAQEVGIYTMLLCRIYEENGPVEYHPARLATYCGTREATFVRSFERLVDLGKLTVECGTFTNPRAQVEIASRETKLKNSSRAGKSSAEKRQQNQGASSTTVQRPFNHTDTDTDTVKKEEPNGSSKKPAARSSQVPGNFQPSPAGMDYAAAKGMLASEIPAQVEKFILHHQAKGSSFKSWDRVWQTWCANFAEFRKARASNVVSMPKPSGIDVRQYHPNAIDMGNGWWCRPGEDVEWYKNTNEMRPDRRTRERQEAEQRAALSGCI